MMPKGRSRKFEYGTMNFPIDKFENIETPFYYYDVELFERTARIVKSEADKYGCVLHYAVKANANKKLLRILSDMGFGADCVSGAEVRHAIDCGFSSSGIVFAGVGKRDDEINFCIDAGIAMFNCESEQEIEVINSLAQAKGNRVDIALRINPEIDAHTHEHLTTGTLEDKFGINLWQLEDVVGRVMRMDSVEITGLHFHIGSQITEISPFILLCRKINELQQQLERTGLVVKHINIGGGLGVDYEDPDLHPVADFGGHLAIINKHIELRSGQILHKEPGRVVVAQCGTLISRCLYVKKLQQKNFAILDAGFTELIRPALYGAYHKIENLTAVAGGTAQASAALKTRYDVVGPICESSDTFGKDILLPETKRGDIFAIRTAGAYGEVMASKYNLRSLPKAYYSTEL
jgi:diaminopimelate decarboxylase